MNGQKLNIVIQNLKNELFRVIKVLALRDSNKMIIYSLVQYAII